VGILVVLVGSAAFWVGRESGRQAARVVAPRPPSLSPTSVPSSSGPAIAMRGPRSPAEPLANARGLTWAIYTSRDRLTDKPLFGAGFGAASGTPLFTVLCVEGLAAVSLKPGLLPAIEGASGNSRSTLDTIRLAVRLAARKREPVDLRFDDALPESLDAIPRRPLDFLRRVAASRRIRTAADDFDPAPWGDAITRVTSECGFNERPAPAAKGARGGR